VALQYSGLSKISPTNNYLISNTQSQTTIQQTQIVSHNMAWQDAVLRMPALKCVVIQELMRSRLTPLQTYSSAVPAQSKPRRCLLDLDCYTVVIWDDIIADDKWTCPACDHQTPAHWLARKERTKCSEQELVDLIWEPTREPEESLNEALRTAEWGLKRLKSSGVWVQTPKDTSYNNLECHGFDFHPNPSNAWIFRKGHAIRQSCLPFLK